MAHSGAGDLANGSSISATGLDPTIPDQLTQHARPTTIEKQWQTERPPAIARTSLLSPKITRRQTNTSMLNQAIWSNPNDVVYDDGSSSSSEDEHVEDPAATKKNGHRRHKDDKAYSRFSVGNNHYNTRGKVSKRDGRLNISVNETNNHGYLAKALGAKFIQNAPAAVNDQNTASTATATATPDEPSVSRPKLNIVVMVIGSRGDIQPFLKLGKNLKEYGHRVRIATHPAFKDFVQHDSGLEFFSVGGDPAELMAFMVKNPGMIPTMQTFKQGEVGRRRDQMAEMFEGFWRACINATDDEKDVKNRKMMGENSPFVADAIIANPPSFAHIHCAERLGIPLHLMFTFPYTPTQEFPHPLANIKKTNVDPGYSNFMSYPLVEMMTWQGLGDLVNTFRVRTLGLEPVSTLWAPGQLYRLKVPYTYLWSPGLVPKPKDWGPEIDIAGFVFLDLASSFKPPEGLTKFLDAGEPPVYIGFGSIVVDDPDKFTTLIFEAVKKAGVRALVSKGWGGLGDDDNTPDNIYMLENTPHDWLFPKVKAVVHHGGAGTTAIGLKCGKPTMIVPFFGDQQFWGSMIGEAGAGAKPVPYKELTADKLADGIQQLLTNEAEIAADKIAKSIEAEGDGAKNAVTSFHRSLPLRGQHSMRCSIFEDRIAVWTMKNTHLRLSALAAQLLVEKKKVSWKQLRLIRHCEWNDFEGPGEPVSGVATAVVGTATGIAAGIGSVPFKIAKTTKRRAKHEEKRRRKSEQPRRSGELGRNKAQKERHSVDGSTNDEIPDAMAPGNANGKATTGPDMGKHTSSGAPIPQNHEFNKPEAEGDGELSSDPDTNPIEDIAQDVGYGLARTGSALARAPMDLSLALAQGFHNAPRLYGDPTVRRPARITGMKSGLKAAGKEFVFGIYDGFSGLIVQPYTGARDNGAIGFVKGVGMGLTGFVLKDLAAIIGPFGYTAKGLHKEVLKGRQPTAFIRKARMVQGQRDMDALNPEGKIEALRAVNHGWSVVLDISAMIDEKRAEGLMGKATVMKERKIWTAHGAFENVEMAEKALQARKNGQSVNEVLAIQKEEIEKDQGPRKNVVDEMKEGQLGDHGDENDMHEGTDQLSAETQEAEHTALGRYTIGAERNDDREMHVNE